MTFILIVLAVAAVAYFILSRGRKSVRAFFYARSRSRGEAVDEANRTANMINFRRASEHNLAMLDYVNKHFRGSQLALIDAARRDGFSQ